MSEIISGSLTFLLYVLVVFAVAGLLIEVTGRLLFPWWNKTWKGLTLSGVIYVGLMLGVSKFVQLAGLPDFLQ